jgi:phosphoribosylglycinamide formyltransferase-1
MKDEKARLAVLVSGGGTNLQALIDAQNSGVIHSGSIRIVISNRADAFALKRAEAAGIKTAVVDKKQLGGVEAFESAIKAILIENKIDYIVLAGFMCILSESFTRSYPERIINVHPSLIPSFCGLRVHEAALEYGVKVTGATVHFVNEIPDGGRIIAQKAVYIENGDTPEALQQRVMCEAEWIILPQAVESVCAEFIESGVK